MNLADMLGFADTQQLSRIADVYQCECNRHSKNELIQSILGAVSRREVFDAQISAMPIEDLRFLSSLLFESRSSFSLEELIARVQQSKFPEPPQDDSPSAAGKMRRSKSSKTSRKSKEVKEVSPRDVVIRFKHQGWLFNGFSGANRYLFQVPMDLKARLLDTMKRRFQSALTYTDEPHVYRDEQGIMVDDIRQLLHYIHHNEVQLTAEGSMYKRFIQAILDRLGVKEELPGRGEWRFGYGRHFNMYPNRMSLLYDYCYYAKYIQETESNLTLTPKGEERLLHQSLTEMEQLYRFWLRMYKAPIPSLLSLAHWINSMASEWVTVDSVQAVLSPYIKPFYYDSSEAIFQQRVMGMMLHLGLLRIGEHETYGPVMRMTIAGKAIMAGVSLDEKDPIVLH
ncbi:hypothetical protein ACFO9Q_12360 [Paenibacillus sp. GCM10023252]|uniref:hypothetical protein n=1 Tax=Paenibacillus sp. GCM10023252 TaxID=3252649 RepID=UPI00360756EB